MLHSSISLPLLLVLLTLIWGTNYSIVKSAFRQIDPHAFNPVRMIIASVIFLAIILCDAVRAKAHRDSG